MPNYPPGFDPSLKVPGIFFAVVFGGAGTSPGTGQKSILLFGAMIASNLTGASPSFTVTAGTASVGIVYQIISGDQADLLWGKGSELALGCKAVFAAYKAATLYAIATATAGGAVAASMTLTIVASSPTPTSINITIAGRTVQYNAVSSDTATTIAAGICNAILSNPDIPATAQNTLGVVTITHKTPCARGNFVPIRVTLVYGTTTLKVGAGALAGTLNGITATLSGGTTSGGAYLMSGGSGAETIATALAAVASTPYDRYVSAYLDTTTADAIVTQLTNMAAITTGLRQQAVVPNVDTYANFVTFTTGRNAPRLGVAWHYNADALPIEVAAWVATIRLFGDSQLGGAVTGEAADPAANLNGAMTGLPVQDAVADRPTPTVINNALNNGGTVLAPVSVRSPYTMIVSSITSRSLSGGLPNYSVYKTKIVTTEDWVAGDISQQSAQNYPGYKAAPDPANGAPIDIPKVVTPLAYKAFVQALLKTYEKDGKLINVDANLPLLSVTQDTTTPGGLGRFLVYIPGSVIPDFDQVAATLAQV